MAWIFQCTGFTGRRGGPSRAGDHGKPRWSQPPRPEQRAGARLSVPPSSQRTERQDPADGRRIRVRTQVPAALGSSHCPAVSASSGSGMRPGQVGGLATAPTIPGGKLAGQGTVLCHRGARAFRRGRHRGRVIHPRAGGPHAAVAAAIDARARAASTPQHPDRWSLDAGDGGQPGDRFSRACACGRLGRTAATAARCACGCPDRRASACAAGATTWHTTIRTKMSSRCTAAAVRRAAATASS